MHSKTSCKMLLSSILLSIVLLNTTEANTIKHHHHHRISDKTVNKELSSEELDKKIASLKRYRSELVEYRRILEDLNEFLTDYDDDEYTDLGQSVRKEDLMEILRHLRHLERKDDQRRHNKKSHHHIKFVDYDPSEMQGDMPDNGNNNIDDSSAEDDSGQGAADDTNSVSAGVLEKFNLTREDLMVLSTRMQGAGGSVVGSKGAGEAVQQDSASMTPQQLRDVFNLTVNGDGRVQWDRNLEDDEFSARAKQLALQQIKKNMLMYFNQPRASPLGPSGSINDSSAGAMKQAGVSVPAPLSRRPLSPRHAHEASSANPVIDEAHRAFLTYAQQFQQQQQQQQMQQQQQRDEAIRDPVASASTLSNGAAVGISDDEFTNRFTEKNVAYHPKCELPRNTDAETWNEGSTLNLHFNVSSSMTFDRPNFTVESAVLRVYKLAQNSTTANVNPSSEDDQIRISVAWYTRSLKKHRVKRKISDSKMVPVSFSGWIELNLKGGVTSWKNGRNHGIAIIVEDQEGAPLRAENYVQKHDCLHMYPRPFPWVILKKFTSDVEDPHFRFPRLDISTRELATYEYQVIPSLVGSFHRAGLMAQQQQQQQAQLLEEEDAGVANGLQRSSRHVATSKKQEDEDTSNELDL